MNRIELIAQLAWQMKIQYPVGTGDTEFIEVARDFVALCEEVCRPKPPKCNTLGPQNLDFRLIPVCDLPNGHKGDHKDGGFQW